MKSQDVPFCCACGKVKDELERGRGMAQWVDMHRYRMKHGFRLGDLRLAKTYCPECGELYRRLKRPAQANKAVSGQQRTSR